MKSFKEFLGEQEEGRKEFRDLLKTGEIKVNIQQQPADATKPRTPRRKRNVGQNKPASTEKPAEPAPPLSPRQQKGIDKGYRTPEGAITQRGVETYATRRGAYGYGDEGKDPSKYGIDPRQVSADARTRSQTAASPPGTPGRSEARAEIRSDVKKIDKNYPPAPAPTGDKSTFSQFSRKASEISGDTRTGRSNISTPQLSKKDQAFFDKLEPDPVARTRAKIDATLGQSADDLTGKSGPQAPTGYSKKGLDALSKELDKPERPVEVKPNKPAPAPTNIKPRVSKTQQVTPKPNRKVEITTSAFDAPVQGPQKPEVTAAAKSAETLRTNANRAPSQQMGAQLDRAAKKAEVRMARTAHKKGQMQQKMGGLGSGALLNALLGVNAYQQEVQRPGSNPVRGVTAAALKTLPSSAAAAVAATPFYRSGKFGAGNVAATAAYTAAQAGGADKFADAVLGDTAKEKELAGIENRKTQPIQKPNFAPPQSRPSQSVIRNPDNPKRETVGYLVKKTDPTTGQVTTGYKAGQGPESLQYDSTNPLERIGRTFFPGAYKDHDRRVKAQDLTNVKTRGYK